MLFSFLLPIPVAVVGLFMLIRLRFFYILHPIRTAKEFISELRKREVRRSFFLALAGTLGVGNIFGVSAGIIIGGPGSIFWLFISSLFAMIIKYSETLLVFDSGIERGGMAVSIRRNFARFGKLLACIYAFFTLLLSLFMGAAMQGAAVIDTAYQTLSLSPYLCLIILLILLTPCIFGDGKKIENITEVIIPLTTIIYIFMCFGVIFVNFSSIGKIISTIVKSALSFKSAACGTLFYFAIKEGFARGILSNEAGVGTSAMAHCRSTDRSPHKAGLFAMCEVVFDSSVLCVLTGISILLSVENVSSYSSPMALVGAAFGNVFGGFSDIVLPFIILSFAYATIICWYYYGTECTCLYFPAFRPIFPILFLFFIAFSGFIKDTLMLYLIDFLLLVMSLITLSLIIKKSERIAKISLNTKEKKNPE